MAADVLIVYGSKHGSTEQVARGIGEKLRGLGFTTTIEPAGTIADLTGFRSVVIGGSIYRGRWHHDAQAFLKRHGGVLDHLPFAVFALGPGKDTPKDFEDSRHQLEHALEKTPGLEPRAVAVFGGVIDPEKLRFPFNHMHQVDLRDWTEIRSWAAALPGELELEEVEHHRELVPF